MNRYLQTAQAFLREKLANGLSPLDGRRAAPVPHPLGMGRPIRRPPPGGQRDRMGTSQLRNAGETTRAQNVRVPCFRENRWWMVVGWAVTTSAGCCTFAGSSAPTQARNARQSPNQELPAPLEPKELTAPTHEIQSWCAVADQGCPDGAFYSSVLTLPNGTVLAATTLADGEHGPLAVVRTDGMRYAASVRCTSLVADPSGMVWCLFVPGPATMTAGWLHGPQASEVEVSYSRNSGATWHLATLDPRILEPGMTVMTVKEGLMFIESNSDHIWLATAQPDRRQVRFSPIGSRLPGRQAGDVVFFAPGRACVQRSTGDRSFGDATLFCTDDLSSSVDRCSKEGNVTISCRALAQQWNASGVTRFYEAASGPQAWWALNDAGRLVRSAIRPLRWREVDVTAGAEVRILSPRAEHDGDVLVAAVKEQSEYVIRVDVSGHVAAWFPMGSIRVTALSADAGRVVVGSPDGVYLLGPGSDSGSWRQVMPACHAK